MSDDFTLEAPGEMRRTAHLSSCRRYRYELWRRWAETHYVMFIGLNPSTADENTDDPTIRKCIKFARRWGFGALCMANLFAFRATDPKVMKVAADPIGRENDQTLIRLAKSAALIVAAWGPDGTHLKRDQRVRELFPSLMCLHLTKDGHPGHPLYLRDDSTPFLLP